MNETTHAIEESLREIEATLDNLAESSLLDELVICETDLRNIAQHLENIRKRLADPIHLVIDNYGGVLQDIDAFETTVQAENYFETIAGVSYEAVCTWEAAERSYSLGLPDEFDTQIWEVKIRRDAR